MRKLFILGILIVFFTGFSYSAARMENLRAHGTNVLLSLAPVDPRALLMGDYMELDYAANSAVLSAWRKKSEASRSGSSWADRLWDYRQRPGTAASGKAVMRLARGGSGLEDGVPLTAEFVRLDDGTPLRPDEILIGFRVRGRRVLTAAPAYYFEEGTGRSYERAAFGRVALGRDGKTLLLALCDESGRDIRPAKSVRD